MLKPNTYPSADAVLDIIRVVALRCIGWSVADAARALSSAGQLGAGIHMIDMGETFSAGMLHAGLLQALAGLDETWRRG